MTAPALETERLTLRARTVADFDDYAAMWRDADVVRFTTGAPMSREDSWLRFCRMAGAWALTGYGALIVREKATGAFVGDIGPTDFGRDIEPSLAGKAEFGWVVSPSAMGRGFATEALAATLAWARAHVPLATYCCIIDPENAPSLRVAAKTGFVRVGAARYKGKTLDLFEQPA